MGARGSPPDGHRRFWAFSAGQETQDRTPEKTAGISAGRTRRPALDSGAHFGGLSGTRLPPRHTSRIYRQPEDRQRRRAKSGAPPAESRSSGSASPLWAAGQRLCSGRAGGDADPVVRRSDLRPRIRARRGSCAARPAPHGKTPVIRPWPSIFARQRSFSCSRPSTSIGGSSGRCCPVSAALHPVARPMHWKP